MATSQALQRFRPQEQALVQVADELGIIRYSEKGAMLIDLGSDKLKAKYNVLAPATTLAKADPNFTPAISVVNLDAEDFYPTAFEGKGQNRHASGWSLSKVQLDQIAKVAGIEDLPPNIVYFGDSGGSVRVTWSARMRRPDGTWQTASGSREWIEADEREKLLAAVPDWVTKDGPADKSNATFNKWWADNWLDRIKRHRLGMTETKARLRAYRSLLTVKSKYGKDDLTKPFLIASTSFTPDTSDLRILGMLMGQGEQATDLLYGPNDPKPVEAEVEVEPHEEEPQCDPETGEILEPETHGEKPEEDKQIPRGPHAGELLSDICREDPEYARAKLLKTEKLGPLTEGWLRYFHGGEDGLDDVDF